MADLFRWEECSEFDIRQVKDLYQQYVSKSQPEVFSPFGFGQTTATTAEGIIIQTGDGQEILDFTGGIGVLNHGHNHPRILKARIQYQQGKRVEVHKNYLSEYIAGLSHNIAQLLPEDLNISYFCNSGAEAVEGAVKLAYKYHRDSREYILRADIAFHGKLLGTGGLTGSPELHFKFPTIPNIEDFEYNNTRSIQSKIDTLRKPDGSSNVYAVLLEPFSASSLRECSGEFLTELQTLCRENDILLIFDEVYTGWAKTGELFYFMKHGVVPDIVTYAKSFGGGKSSIAGYTTREKFFRKAYDNMADVTLHSTTYNGFGEETVTAIEALNIIVEDDYVGRSNHIHEFLFPRLKGLMEKYPNMIRELRGSGALNGIILNDEVHASLKLLLSSLPSEMLKDERFFAKLLTSAVIAEMYDSHNILLFFGSNREIPLIISPSLIVTDEQMDTFVDALDATLALGRVKLLKKFIKSYLSSRMSK